MPINKFLLATFLFLGVGLTLNAQQNKTADIPAVKLNASERKDIIETLVQKVNDYYVYPDVAHKMTSALLRNYAHHDYDTITDPATFARLLTSHLQTISKDGHLGVDYSADPIPNHEDPGAPSDDDIASFRLSGARNNYNFRKVERLDGNIGLLQLDAFYPADWIKEIAAGAMSFLVNADAIIIDLRSNHGFAPDGVLLMESYFFKEETHMTDHLDRDAKSTRQYWTLPTVPGPSLAGKELYILTSHNTFSAGEDFAYNLQAQSRAKVIGETTGGGAHGTKPYRIGTHFTASIPFTYSVNPITHSDWEGTGVKPDVSVPASQALLTAHVAAMRTLIKRMPTETDRIDELKKVIEQKEGELNALKSKVN